jgi:hypothetical protein
MLYEFLIPGEDARWQSFKKAEQEAQRREGLRNADGGRRKLSEVGAAPRDSRLVAYAVIAATAFRFRRA